MNVNTKRGRRYHILHVYPNETGIIDLVVIDTEDLGVVVLSAFVAHQTDGSLVMKLK